MFKWVSMQNRKKIKCFLESVHSLDVMITHFCFSFSRPLLAYVRSKELTQLARRKPAAALPDASPVGTKYINVGDVGFAAPFIDPLFIDLFGRKDYLWGKAWTENNYNTARDPLLICLGRGLTWGKIWQTRLVINSILIFYCWSPKRRYFFVEPWNLYFGVYHLKFLEKATRILSKSCSEIHLSVKGKF